MYNISRIRALGSVYHNTKNIYIITLLLMETLYSIDTDTDTDYTNGNFFA